MKDKILLSKFWKYLPRPSVIVQETDGFNEDLPLIFRDLYDKSTSTAADQIRIETVAIEDKFDPSRVNCIKVDKYLKDRQNPNDADFEKEELRISHLATFQPRSQSFLAQRAKNTSMLHIQGTNPYHPPYQTKFNILIDRSLVCLSIVVLVSNLNGDKSFFLSI